MSSPGIARLSNRCRIITFDDGISILLICGPEHTFLCDTHLGPESMQEIIPLLAQESVEDVPVIFNSHSDWDHIWGNCSFPDSVILAHESCLTRMKERGLFDLTRLSSLARGEVVIRYPNLLFSERIIFETDDVVFIHAPGHTLDSSICLDRKDKILFLGDLVEDPIPYLDWTDLERYLDTLAMLLDLPPCIMVSAHSGIVDRELISRNIAYITSMRDGLEVDASIFGEYASVHRFNLNTRCMFAYELRVKELLGEEYSFTDFWSLVPDLEETSTEELRQSAGHYIARLERGR